MSNKNTVNEKIISECRKNNKRPLTIIETSKEYCERKWYYADCTQSLKKFDIDLYNLSSDVLRCFVIPDDKRVKVFNKALEWMGINNKVRKEMFTEKIKGELRDIARDCVEAEIVRVAEVLIKFRRQASFYVLNKYNKSLLH